MCVCVCECVCHCVCLFVSSDLTMLMSVPRIGSEVPQPSVATASPTDTHNANVRPLYIHVHY